MAVMYIGGAAIICMGAVTIADIFTRTFLSYSLMGSYELVQLTLAMSVFSGLAEGFWRKAHIVIDLIDQIASPMLGALLSLFATLISLGMISLLIWLCIGQAQDTLFFGDITADLRLSKIWFWIPIIVGLSTACLALTLMLIEQLFLLARPFDERGK